MPFVQHPQGASYIPQYDPVTEAYIGQPDEGSIYYNKVDPHAEMSASVAFITDRGSKQRSSSSSFNTLAAPTKAFVISRTISTGSTGADAGGKNEVFQMPLIDYHALDNPIHPSPSSVSRASEAWVVGLFLVSLILSVVVCISCRRPKSKASAGTGRHLTRPVSTLAKHV